MADFALFPWSGRRILDSNGAIAASAKLKVYDAGTVVERYFYSDTALSVQISWPITCDANGLVPKAYMPAGLYDMVVTESDDTTIVSYDDLPGASGDITGLSELTLVNDEADYLLVYDSSASEHKQVLAKNLGFTASGDDATLRTLQSKLRDFKTTDDFGLVGDGATDNSTALQAAIDSFSADDGGVLYVPMGNYRLASQVHVDRPVLIVGEGDTDISTNANTSGTLGTQFKWSGASGEVMFLFGTQTQANMEAGTTTDEFFFGGGMVNVFLHGNDTAAVGIWAASTVRSKFHVHVRQFTESGIRVDGGNNALSSRNEFLVHMVWGTAAAVDDMDGIHFRRYNSIPSTQNRILSASGLHNDGSVLHFEDTDNNVVNHVQGVQQSGGTGYAVHFANGSTNHARQNLIFYCSGDVKCESSTHGNRILHHNSEGAYIDIDSGGQIHYDAIDYVNDDLFTTQKYWMSDHKDIPAQAMHPDGTNGTFALAASLWMSISMPTGVTSHATASFSPPRLWSTGSITAVTVTWVNGGTSGGDVDWRVRFFLGQSGSVATPSTNELFTENTSSTNHGVNEATLTLSSADTFTAGDALLFRIDREGGADANTDTIFVIGVKIHFESDGPANTDAGANNYVVSPI